MEAVRTITIAIKKIVLSLMYVIIQRKKCFLSTDIYVFSNSYK